MYAQVTLAYIHMYCTCIACKWLCFTWGQERGQETEMDCFNSWLNVKLKYWDLGGKRKTEVQFDANYLSKLTEK